MYYCHTLVETGKFNLTHCLGVELDWTTCRVLVYSDQLPFPGPAKDKINTTLIITQCKYETRIQYKTFDNIY